MPSEHVCDFLPEIILDKLILVTNTWQKCGMTNWNGNGNIEHIWSSYRNDDRNIFLYIWNFEVQFKRFGNTHRCYFLYQYFVYINILYNDMISSISAYSGSISLVKPTQTAICSIFISFYHNINIRICLRCHSTNIDFYRSTFSVT